MSQADRVLLIVLAVAIVAAVASLLRMPLLDPAPAFSRGSLRRAAVRLLDPPDIRARARSRLRLSRRRLRPVTGRLWYAAAAAALALPIHVSWGPLGSSTQSTSYLDALWVVVAASLGLSVAMVAFAFVKAG